MKISQIIQETTTSGSVAPVELGFVKMQTRNPSVYGGNKVGNLLKGKKTSKPFANSVNESKMKDLAYDMETLKPAEFQKKYGKSREQMKASPINKPAQPQKTTPPVNEADLSEQDLILVPGQGRKLKAGFIPHDKDRTDREVEMAVSDLFSAGKNAEKIYNIVRSISEDEGLEGWVQEKIIKANDYLNTVREYLEGKQLKGIAEGQGNFDTAINNLHGWYEQDSTNPNIKTYEFDDREGGYYAYGTVEHNLKTGVITIDFEDRSGYYGGEDIKGTYNSIGDAMNVLRTITIPHKYNTSKAQNFDRLGRRVPVTTDKLRKTDRTGRKGTIGGAHATDLKYSIQHNKDRHGPKGILPESDVAEGAKVDRMVKHIAKSEKKLGKSKDEAENIAWATANKRGMLDNKNKKA